MRLIRSTFLALALALTILAPVAIAAEQKATGQETVYVTRTGKKYHTATCRYLRSSKIPMKLSDAAKAGYTPCSVCNPPTMPEK
jgi:hypothetical protein